MIISRTKSILLVCFVSIAVHLPGIASPLLDIHSWRQTQTAAIARNYHENGYHFLSPQINWEGHFSGTISTEFPIYNYLLALLWPTAGLGDIWGRILSSLFAMLAAVYMYLLAKELLDEETALLSALIFTVLPVGIYFTHTVQPEALGLLGMIAGLYHIRKRGWGHMTAAAVFLSLAPLVKLPYAYIWLPAAWLAFKNPNRKTALAALAFPVLTVIVWYFHFAGRAAVQVVPSNGGLFSMMSQGQVWFSSEFYEKLFVSRFPELVTTYTGLLLFFIGIRKCFKISESFFSLWLFSGIAYLILGGYYTYEHEYTLLPLTAPVAVFIALGFARLRAGNSKWLKTAAIVLLVAIPLNAGLRIRHWYELRDVFLLNARERIPVISAREDLFLCNINNLPLYLYHIHRNGFSQLVSGPDFKKTLAGFIKKDVKFFLTSKAALREDAAIEKYVRTQFPVVDEGKDYLIFRIDKGYR